MPGPIDPVQIAQILKGEDIQKPALLPQVAPESPFSQVLDNALKALQDISATENNSNMLIDKYTTGSASISDVMIATAKTNISVQLAVTAITSAVNTFKEITQMQI